MLLSLCATLLSLFAAVPQNKTFAIAATPNNKTFCCGAANAADCGSPDVTQLSFAFNKDATQADIKATFDSQKSACKAESCKFAADGAVTFPTSTKATDCLAKFIVSTGAPITDLSVSYDASKDTLEVDIDSEGLEVTLSPC